MTRTLTVLALGLLVACTITEPLCGCSIPGPPSLIVTGVVTDPADAPVPGALVKLRLLDQPSCQEREGQPSSTVQAGTSGRFRVEGAIAPGPGCFRLSAEPPQGRALAESEGRIIQVDRHAGGPPDSVHVVLRLR